MQLETEILAKLFACYNLFLIVVSFLLNPVVIFICLRSQRLRSISTFKILAFSAINDILTCIPWNQESFTNTFFDFQPYFRSFVYCRWISVFMQYTTIQLQSWILVSISLDRCFTLVIPRWPRKYFFGRRPVVCSIFLAFIISLVNVNEVFTIGYVDNINGAEIINCYKKQPSSSVNWYQVMAKVLLYFGFIVPYALLISLNSFIIYKATTFQRVKHSPTTSHERSPTRSARRKTRMTRTILFITFLYIFATLPSTVITGYYYNYIMKFEIGQTIINLINGIQFSYPAFHFFILCFSSKRFAREVKLTWFNLSKNGIWGLDKRVNNAIRVRRRHYINSLI